MSDEATWKAHYERHNQERLEALNCNAWQAQEIARLRADLDQLKRESDAEITALRACLASAEADLSAAQEREGALREALVRLEAMVRILPPDMDEPGSALAQARTALGETQ